MKKRFLQGLLCALITACLSGCGDAGGSSSVYGESIKEVNTKDLYMIYDGNFISDEEMKTVADYFNSIQKKDYALFRSTQPEPYLSYLKDKNSMDLEKFLSDQYSQNASELGENFDFVQIEVTDCGDRKSDSGINDIKELLDGIYSDTGMEKSFSDTIKSAKYIVYDMTASDSSGKQYLLNNRTKYVFSCDDGIFIF